MVFWRTSLRDYFNSDFDPIHLLSNSISRQPPENEKEVIGRACSPKSELEDGGNEGRKRHSNVLASNFTLISLDQHCWGPPLHRRWC